MLKITLNLKKSCDNVHFIAIAALRIVKYKKFDQNDEFFYCGREPQYAYEVFQLLLIVGVCTLLLNGNNVDHNFVKYRNPITICF